ncbi:hypothetical protein DFH27DRAFT_602029 [Peziza echinospora]|nr:hypothetical protein DFH27DRAFT_602029 [Peziza echinospora]
MATTCHSDIDIDKISEPYVYMSHIHILSFIKGCRISSSHEFKYQIIAVMPPAWRRPCYNTLRLLGCHLLAMMFSLAMNIMTSSYAYGITYIYNARSFPYGIYVQNDMKFSDVVAYN